MEDILREQYADALRLDARIRLHARFSTNKYGWFPWLFDRLRLPERCKALELGCGSGALWLINRQRIPAGWNLVLSDFSPGMAAEARQTLAEGGLSASFVVCDAQVIPFASRHFDAVIANHMLYHLPDRHRALGEIRRVLKPGGRFYASTTGSDHMQELSDILSSWSSAGYTPERFNMETGEEQLRRHFGEVSLHRYPDTLAVTEAEPLIEYARSMIGAETKADQVAQFAAIVRDKIASEGVVHITKNSVLFEAERR